MRWAGGNVHTQKDGRPLYVIERTVHGRRYHVSTRAHSLRAAMRQLERFEADPAGYVAQSKPLLLDAALLEQFLDSLMERRLTKRYVREVGNRLVEWAEDFGTKDLRSLSLRDDLLPALSRRGGRKARIIALKSLFAWLRRRALVERGKDPTLDLPVPQGSPEKLRRRKAVSADLLRQTWRKLKGAHRDVFQLQVATGLHLTEVERFVRHQDAELVDTPAGVVVVVRHKTGVLTRVPIEEKGHIEAARRLWARGKMPRWYPRAVREASGGGVTYGVIRHSVATFAREKGATPEQIAAFLHHRDKRTTERFYIDLAEPVPGVPVLRLVR